MAITTRRKHSRAAMLAVEYPRQNEKITSSTYTVRVYAPENAKTVGISIDQGEWTSCRPSVGYWWYDWSGYENGEHEISVSMETSEGTRIIAEPHEFFVALAGQPVAP